MGVDWAVTSRAVEYLELLATLDFETKEVVVGKVFDSLYYFAVLEPSAQQ
jgi:hypothetical protein